MSDSSDGVELLPCPFDGGEAHVSGGIVMGYAVDCLTCRCSMGHGLSMNLFDTIEQLTEAWNTRANQTTKSD